MSTLAYYGILEESTGKKKQGWSDYPDLFMNLVVCALTNL